MSAGSPMRKFGVGGGGQNAFAFGVDRLRTFGNGGQRLRTRGLNLATRDHNHGVLNRSAGDNFQAATDDGLKARLNFRLGAGREQEAVQEQGASSEECLQCERSHIGNQDIGIVLDQFVLADDAGSHGDGADAVGARSTDVVRVIADQRNRAFLLSIQRSRRAWRMAILTKPARSLASSREDSEAKVAF